MFNIVWNYIKIIYEPVVSENDVFICKYFLQAMFCFAKPATLNVLQYISRDCVSEFILELIRDFIADVLFIRDYIARVSCNSL